MARFHLGMYCWPWLPTGWGSNYEVNSFSLTFQCLLFLHMHGRFSFELTSFRFFHLWYYPKPNIEIFGQVIILQTVSSNFELVDDFSFSCHLSKPCAGTGYMDTHLLLRVYAILNQSVTLVENSLCSSNRWVCLKHYVSLLRIPLTLCLTTSINSYID